MASSPCAPPASCLPLHPPAPARRPDTGLERPYRPRPADFRETYIAIGWETICQHYRTNWRCVRRWIDETGRAELKEARRAYVLEHGPHLLHVEPRERFGRRSQASAMTAVNALQRTA